MISIEEIQGLGVGDTVMASDLVTQQWALENKVSIVDGGLNLQISKVTDWEDDTVCWRLFAFEEQGGFNDFLLATIADGQMDLKLLATPDWFEGDTRRRQVEDLDNAFLFTAPESDEFTMGNLKYANVFEVGLDGKDVEFIQALCLHVRGEDHVTSIVEYNSLQGDSAVIIESGGTAEEGGYMEFFVGHAVGVNDLEAFLLAD